MFPFARHPARMTCGSIGTVVEDRGGQEPYQVRWETSDWLGGGTSDWLGLYRVVPVAYVEPHVLAARGGGDERTA